MIVNYSDYCKPDMTKEDYTFQEVKHTLLIS